MEDAQNKHMRCKSVPTPLNEVVNNAGTVEGAVAELSSACGVGGGQRNTHGHGQDLGRLGASGGGLQSTRECSKTGVTSASASGLAGADGMAGLGSGSKSSATGSSNGDESARDTWSKSKGGANGKSTGKKSKTDGMTMKLDASYANSTENGPDNSTSLTSKSNESGCEGLENEQNLVS